MSPLMERLGVKYPLFQGGMAWVAEASSPHQFLKLAAWASLVLVMPQLLGSKSKLILPSH